MASGLQKMRSWWKRPRGRNLTPPCEAKISTRKEAAWKEGTAEVHAQKRQSGAWLRCAEQSCRNITQRMLDKRESEGRTPRDLEGFALRELS